MRLHDDDGPLRVDAGRQEHVDRVDGVALEVGLGLAHGDGVQVDGAVDAVVGLLHGDEVADGPQVVAQVQRAGRLDAAEDARPPGRRGRVGPSTGARRPPPGRSPPAVRRCACLSRSPWCWILARNVGAASRPRAGA